MKYALLAGAMLAATGPAYAQTAAAPAAPAAAPAPAPTVGATVYDAQGGVVGTIASIDGSNVVVDTGTNKVGIAAASLGTGPKGPVLGMTKVQLDEAYAASAAQAQSALLTKLTPGTAVKGTAGTELAKVKTADAQFVTLTTASGDVRLPIAAFAAQADGSVMIGMTADEFTKAIAASKAS